MASIRFIEPNIEHADPRASYMSDAYEPSVNSAETQLDIHPSETSTPKTWESDTPPGIHHSIPVLYAPGQEGYAEYPPTSAANFYPPADDDELSPVGYDSTLRKRKTTMSRRIKTVKLSQTGNFVIKQRVPEEVVKGVQYGKGEEFESMRYTAATCDPDNFIERGYNLRCANYQRQIEIFVVVTMYNEDHEGFNRTMFALAQNLKYLCEKNKNGWDADGWKKVAICIVADGRSKIHPTVLKVLEVMGVYQDGVAQSAVNGDETTAHIFEYTPQKVLDTKMQLWGPQEGIPPIQTIFCLKEKNAKKINSHRWFFRAFSALLDPRVCVLIDVGTKPSANSLYSLWKAFYRNDQIAGACGEIRADLGQGLTYFKNIMNPLVASQNFEYKISNLLDKSLESAFGYISVLPGAFSAYRWQALQDLGPGQGPLSKYFEGEARVGKPQDSSIFSANLYLAEDRILCFELVAKPNARWTLHYVNDAKADTDVPESIPEFLSQRRRWLNGSLFAGFYALANITRMWSTRHSLLRKLAFTIQYLYNVVNQVFSWFILGNFAITFFFLFGELEQILSDPTSVGKSPNVRTRIIQILLGIARFSYPVVLVCLFIISFGNRPQAFRRTYKAVMFGFGVIGAVMIGLLVRRLIQTVQFVGTQYNMDYGGILRPLVDPAVQPTSDGGQLLMNTLVVQVARVMRKDMDVKLGDAKRESLVYAVTLASTVGVYFLASFLQLDFAHMFTCFLQYLLLLPSYINVLTVYALSNLHDVSWGTKGESKPTTLPTVQAQKQSDGTVVADVSISTDQTTLAQHYSETLDELRTLPSNQPLALQDPKTQQEDDYKSFRTVMMLSYLSSNAVLFAVGTTWSGNGYLNVLLSCTAGLAFFKLMGVLWFLGMKGVVKVFGGRTVKGRYKKEQGVLLRDTV
ncbi:chitin synthase [Spizellomyces sp. 'palustris']|nr:chitin synthase [Spizellomyces sp. 'palustris']